MRTSVASGYSALFASLLVGALIAACSGNSDDAALAALSGACTVNSDCNDPLVCAFKECHDKCDTSRDCPDGELCLASDRPFHVCQLPAEASCSSNAQCPTGEVCGIDNNCRDACATDRDCLTDEYCSYGTCVVTGKTITTVDAGVAVGATCTYNSDCPLPLECRNGMCAFDCKETRDCTNGQICVGNLCIDSSVTTTGDASSGDATMMSTQPEAGSGDNEASAPVDASPVRDIPDGAPPDYGTTCALNSDCSTTLICTNARCVYECVTTFDCDAAHGYCCTAKHVCLSGSICTTMGTSDGGAEAGSPDAAADAGHEAGAPCTDDRSCQDGVYCNGYERCISGTCHTAATACDDADPCTTDACNEAGQMCTHTPTGPMDQDGDGHFAKSCGGSADDCDDTNPDVYPGHPEVCDFVDNNCDGFIDENAWLLGAATSLSGSPNQTAFPLDMARLNDGSIVYAATAPTATSTSNSQLAGWKLSPALAVTKAATRLAPDLTGNFSNNYSLNIATDGTTFAVGAILNNTTGIDIGISSGDFATEEAVAFVGSTGVARTAVAWNLARGAYSVVWADNHAGGNYLMYGGEASNTGTITHAAHTLISDTTVDALNATNSLPFIASGPSNLMVVWVSITSNHVRYAIFEPTLTSVVAGPFDLPATENAATQLFSSGGSYYLTTTTSSGSGAMVRQLDATGNVTASQAFSFSPLALSSPQISILPNGYIFSAIQATTIRFAYSPTLAGSYSFSQFLTPGAGPSVNTLRLLGADAQHVVVGYDDGTYKAAMAACTH